jgi:putative tricarboxylic transport membrane protein
MQRRQLMRAAAAWGAMAAGGRAWGQAAGAARAAAPAPFPRLRMLIPANAGGGWDQTGRALGAALLAAGQAGEVEYENKGGKGGVIGLAHFVEKYGADPAALMVGGFVMVGSVALNRPAIDLGRVTPLARLTSELSVLVVPANSRYRNMAAFAADLKAKPAAVAIAGGGAGGVDHMCAGMIARAVGVDPAALAYQPFSSGSEVLAAVSSGKVAAAISGYGELKEGIASGAVRALGVTSRRAAFGVPSMVEQGLQVELANWRGVFAAAGLSAAQLGALRDAVQKATQHAAWKEALQHNNWQAAWLTGPEFQQALDWDQSMARVLVQLLHLKGN